MSFKKIRSWLILLVLVVVFPSMILIVGYAFWEQRRQARLQSQETALRVVRLAALEQDRIITATEHLLMALSQLPAVRRPDAAKCSELFGEFMKKLPFYTNLAAADAEGNIFCSGLATGPRANIADRPYFQEAMNERRLGISHLMKGRMSGRPNISIAYPAFDIDGPVYGVVFAGLDLKWLNSVAARAQLPPRSTVMAVDQIGGIFAHYPETEKWVGKSATTPLIETIIEEGEGVIEAEGLDGIRRLYAFTTLHPSPRSGALFVTVGIPYDVAFAESNRLLNHSLLLFLITLLLAAAATWVGAHLLIRKKLERLISAAHALGEFEPEQTGSSAPNKDVAENVDQYEKVLQEMRESLNKATDRQADFAAMIAHDLRNPLQAVASSASLLREKGEHREDERVLIQIIGESCSKLTNILDEFLEFSRYRAGYLHLQKEPIEIGEWLRETQGRYAARSQESRISLEVAAERQIGFISADREKLDRLIDNLLNNALKFTQRYGRIEIGARREGEGVEIWVKDTGIGIAQDEANKLFSKYQQSERSRSSHKPGTGLGLLICKMIAEGHGGRIWAHSELNQGTVFYVWFPRNDAKYLATGTE